MSQALDSLMYFALLGLLCGVVSFRLGFRIGTRIALPLTQTLLGFLAFAASWRASGAVAAAIALAGWAVGASMIAMGAFGRDPGATATIPGAETFAHGMFRWLERGRGPRGGASATVSRLVRWLATFLLAATLTAGAGAVAVGALLLNVKNAWVATFIGRAERPGIARALAWNAWSVVRVVAFAALGSACAAPLATRLGYPPDPVAIQRLLTFGAVALIVDLMLELTLSELYRERLARALPPTSDQTPSAKEPPERASANS